MPRRQMSEARGRTNRGSGRARSRSIAAAGGLAAAVATIVLGSATPARAGYPTLPPGPWQNFVYCVNVDLHQDAGTSKVCVPDLTK